mgnify:CR=1 FL=1
MAVIEKAGRPAIEVIGEIVPEVMTSFPWPKSMRWGERSAKPGALAWVRPLHSIVATFGPETEEPDIVPFAVDGIAAGDATRGHRFLAPASVHRCSGSTTTWPSSKRPRSCSIRERRKEMILADAKNLAFAQGYELVEDAGLLAEVAGLVEWPVVLMGSFDEAFLSIPPEVIRTTIRANQKCFVLRDPDDWQSSSTNSSWSPTPRRADGGKAIVAGNERVIRARLSDAKFFYETDLKTRLEDRLPKIRADHLPRRSRHAVASSIERIERIGGRYSRRIVGADMEESKRAAHARESRSPSPRSSASFPSCRASMGRHYRKAQGRR